MIATGICHHPRNEAMLPPAIHGDASAPTHGCWVNDCYYYLSTEENTDVRFLCGRWNLA
jgi:hypothetical protein